MTDLGDREKYRQKARRSRPQRDLPHDSISRDVSDSYDLVPEIGNGYRWYDYPYRLLWWIAGGWRRKALPRRIRKWINFGINYLHPFNGHDRNKAWSRESTHHNVFVPDNEHVNVAGIWLVELFPPTELPALDESLARNGWDRAGAYAYREGGNRDALQKARAGGRTYWWRLVDIVRRDSTRFIPDGRREKLPEEFEYVELRALQVGAGLTAVVAEFHLSDAAAASLDNEWHRQHEPLLLWDKGRPKALDRQWATFLEVQSARGRLHSTARTWLGQRLPGFFAADNKSQPLLDLLLFDALDPTSTDSEIQNREEEIKADDALRALGISKPVFRQLLSADLPKLVLSPLDGQMNQALPDDPTWTLWGSRAAVIQALGEDELQGYGSDQNRAIASRLVDNMQNLFVMLAVSEFLSVTEEKFAVIRDQASRRHGKFKPKSLENLRNSFLTHSLNLSSVHRDTVRFWNRSWRWDGDAEFYYYPTPNEVRRSRGERSKKEQPESFNDALKNRHQRWFDELLEADRDYRGILSTVASLGASADSYKVSRLALWVSIGSLIVALATVVTADVGADSFVAQLWRIVRP